MHSGARCAHKNKIDNSLGLKDTCKQIKEGYNVSIFGYGYSGSGKTYTLLEGNGIEDPSLLVQLIIDMKNS